MKKVLNIILILNLLLVGLTFSVLAQEEGVLDRSFRNLGAFFTSFIDTNDLFRHTLDDIYIDNQCIRRDIFAVHTIKTQVSDLIIDNYTKITEPQLKSYELFYTMLQGELVFLRNLDILLGADNKYDVTNQKVEELLIVILSKVDNGPLINFYFPKWMQTYGEKLSEYEQCENSWTKVNKRVASIKEKRADIVVNYNKLKEELNKTKDMALDTPNKFWENSSKTIEESFTKSWAESTESFDTFTNEITELFSQEKWLADLKKNHNAIVGNQSGLNDYQLRNIALTEIGQYVEKPISVGDLDGLIKEALKDLYTNQIAINTLQPLFLLEGDLKKINILLQEQNKKGIYFSTNEILKKQCSI